MKKRLVLFISLVFLLAGCTGLSKGTDQSSDSAFVGGTKALSLAFAGDEPPAKVLDDNQEEFFITLLLKNEGEFTIPKGRILASLSGISKEAFSLNSLNVKSDFDLERVRKDRDLLSAGGIEELSFGMAKYKSDLPADFDTDIRANVCYDYETQAVASICLKKNPLERGDEDSCLVDNQAVKVENSGAPVQVVGFRQRPTSGSKILVSFDVSNKGIGKAYSPSTFTDVCKEMEDNADMIEVSLSSSSGNMKISCSKFGNSNKGIVRLVNNIKTVSCDIDTSGIQDISYQDFLIVKMRYMYRDLISVPITIEDAQ